MVWSTIFANLAAGNQPLSLFDAMFTQISGLSAIPCTAASNNAISLTGLSNAPTLTSYTRYVMFRFRAAGTSSGAVTINFGGIGALNAYKSDGTTQVGANDILSGQEYLAVYDSALNAGAGGFFLEAAAIGGLTSLSLSVPPIFDTQFFTGTVTPNFQVLGSTANTGTAAIARYSADVNPGRLVLAKSRGASPGTHVIVQSGDIVGELSCQGSNGTSFDFTGAIRSVVDGTPGASNDMPGRWEFYTVADGTASLVEAMRIDSVQRVTIGGNIGSVAISGTNPRLEVNGIDAATSFIGDARFSADANGPTLGFAKSRNATLGSHTIVQNNDFLGSIIWYGSNGTTFDNAAMIRAEVDAAPGASADMPARIVLYTANDGTATLTEKVRVTNDGRVIQFNGTALTAGGNTSMGYLFSSSAVGVYVGSGAPTISAAQGSLYLRSDGVPSYNNNGSTGWTSLAAGGGGITTIQSGSLPAAAVQDITGIAATFAYLMVVMTGASSNTAARQPLIQVSTNNGSTFDSTVANYFGFVFNGGGGVTAFTKASLVETIDVGAANTFNISVAIFGYQGGPRLTCLGQATENQTPQVYSIHGNYQGSTSAINAIRLLWDGTGNFDAGTYAVYGIS